MNAEQLTRLASFAGKSSNDFWMATGKKPTDVIAELAAALLEANWKVSALVLANAGLKQFSDTLFRMYRGLEISGGGIHDEQLVVRRRAVLDAAMSAFEKIENHATGAAVAQIESRVRDDVIDWFETEIMAIDPVYRGSPSYTHDGYDIKHKALELAAKARAAFDAELREAK